MEKYYIIPKELALQLNQIKLEWYKGVDATLIEDGNYIISEWAFNELKKYNKIVIVAEKEVNIAIELVKYPLIDEKNIIFKQIE